MRPVLDEEIGNAIRLTKDGKVVNERARQLIQPRLSGGPRD
jgi:hypothetical protein